MSGKYGSGGKRAVGYVRVSTEDQKKRGYSMPEQRRSVEEWAAREGYEVVGWVEDGAWSGYSLVRPGLERVRELAARGEMDCVVAAFRDRLARDFHAQILRLELEELGVGMIALNDIGDDSPDGQLVGAVMDAVSGWQGRKIAQLSRLGKQQKARQGKILAGYRVNHGFKLNAARDGYEVDEDTMPLVRRAVRMVGEEGATTHSVAKTFERESIPTPSGRKYWTKKLIRNWILNDVYRPHTHEEVSELVSAEVAASLDPNQLYGIRWYGQQRHRRFQVYVDGPDGREPKKRTKVSPNDPDEWIPVPVPDAGIPGRAVDAARAAVAEYRSPSKVDGRFWELSGALMRCGECGRAMEAVARTARKRTGGKYVFCYYRCREGNRRRDECPNRKSVRSDKVHAAVWELVSGLLKDPERLRRGLERMIEREREGTRGGHPEREAKAWLQKLAEADDERRGYHRLAAKGRMTDEELDDALAELEETRRTARRELKALEGRRERLRELQRGKDALLESYASRVPEALDVLPPEARHAVYRMLRLRVVAHPDGPLDVHGTFGAQGLGVSGPLWTSYPRPPASFSPRPTTTRWASC